MSEKKKKKPSLKVFLVSKLKRIEHSNLFLFQGDCNNNNNGNTNTNTNINTNTNTNSYNNNG